MVVFGPPQWRSRIGSWEIDAARSSAAFIIDDVVAGFPRITGTLAGDPDSWEGARMAFMADTASVQAGSLANDEYVRSPDVLDVAQYPQVSFRGRAAEGRDGDRFFITGELRVRGRTVPLTFEAGTRTAFMRDTGESVYAAGDNIEVRTISARATLSAQQCCGGIRERAWGVIAPRYVEVLLHAHWVPVRGPLPAA